MGTWTHPALARKRRTAYRNNAVEQRPVRRRRALLPFREAPREARPERRSNSSRRPLRLPGFCQYRFPLRLRVPGCGAELGKPAEDLLKLPVVLKLNVDLLPGQAILQIQHTARQIFDFRDRTLEIGLFSLHVLSPEATPKRISGRIRLRRKKQVADHSGKSVAQANKVDS